jgi:23S rRNA (uracil1939-C5)-methyltransferase
VELDPRAVAYAERTGVSAARHAGRAESLVGTLPDPELVIVNPPRTGMDARVPTTLLDRRPRRIVYISCDPATLARDVGRLAAEYRLVEARCFDLFPQTAHVETVAVLERG